MDYLREDIIKMLLLFFLLITFGISSFEKMEDWNGNVEFIRNHFKGSPLKNYVPFLLLIILVFNLLGCVFSVIGLFELFISGNTFFSFYGIAIFSSSLIFLLIGQRLAKDYEGAANITIYFILTVFALFIFK